MRFKKHIFICTNERDNGKKCCGQEQGLALVAAFKKELKDKGLHIDVRAQRAGCIEACDFGPGLVIYPEGTYYGNVQLENVSEIIEQHIIDNKIIEHLKINF
ncbi:MAG: ferredoxin [Bacteroidetes bacterium RIFCSPLOWO2_12_FULL_31_6]|nr:MAG: ferredoxin [Bacteroidetes bacterium RIFCSPLOWO2_12_FULL_31_6]